MRSYWLIALVATLSLVTNSVTAVERHESMKSTVFTSVFAVNAPTNGEKDFTVLSTADGRAYKVDASNEAVLSVLRLALSTNRSVELKLHTNNSNLIESAELLDASRTDAFSLLNWEKSRPADIAREARNLENKLDEDDYKPSVLENKAEAQELFDSVYAYDKGYDVDDHCFDRAHYWARSMYVNKKIKSMKVFIFFTPKYQREHNYKWWFHVAPFVYVGDSEREMVIDPTFESEVLTMRQWSLDFAEKAKKCYDGDDMDAYNKKGETEDCVLIRASMYHYTPSDLNTVPSVRSWRCSDLKRVTSGIPAPFKKRSWDDISGFLPAGCR